MNKFKYIIVLSFSLIFCLYIGLTIYNNKKIYASISDASYSIYLLQYGVYSDKSIMEENGKNISNYYYYEDEDGYHIIIGIMSNKDLSDKIKNAFEIESDIYIKEKKIRNREFYENLLQYDKLISNTSSSLAIVNAEKQILGKYEELVLYE